MKILMLKDDLTTVDTRILKEFKAGQTYDVRQSTGCRLIERGSAKLSPEDPGEIHHTQHEIRE